MRAVVPAPVGGYPAVNTAEGQNALFNLTTAVGNTAVGWLSLWSDTYSNVEPIVGTDPDSVTITNDGGLGRGNVSSRRYKHDIKLMDTTSETVYALKPITFRYNKEYDATQTLAFGLIAEDVAEVNPALV